MSEGQIFSIFMELWGVVASAICTFKFVKGRRRRPNFKGLKLNYTASGVGLGEYESFFFFLKKRRKKRIIALLVLSCILLRHLQLEIAIIISRSFFIYNF